MSGCGKGLGTHWIDDWCSMHVKCGESIINNNRQYCEECIAKLPGCHNRIGFGRSVPECGIPQGMPEDNLPTQFCDKCKN